MCISPAMNPYVGTPVFYWDSINNSGKGRTGNISEVAALVGQLDNGEDIKTSDGNFLTGQTYNIIGVVNKDRNDPTFVLLNSTQNISEECSGTCTLSAGDTSVANIPDEIPYIFSYISKPTSQQLNVYYYEVNNADATVELKSLTSGEVNTPGPTLTTPKTGYNLTDFSKKPLLALRIYETPLSTRELMNNLKVDKKRFGMDVNIP